LADASVALKNDREIVLAAVTQKVTALEYASDALKNDREIILAAVTQNGYALRYASDALKNDREIVLIAVNEKGLALMDASVALKNDREIVLAAVTNTGTALEFVPVQFQNDREIVLAAVTLNEDALEYASDEIKRDKNFWVEAIARNRNVIPPPQLHVREYITELLTSNKMMSKLNVSALATRRHDFASAAKPERSPYGKLAEHGNVQQEMLSNRISGFLGTLSGDIIRRAAANLGLTVGGKRTKRKMKRRKTRRSIF
jgi:hypothetical protein